MAFRLQQLNVIGECRDSGIGIWSCPPFLFVIMGVLNVAAMISSYLISRRYVEEPEFAALIVLAVSAVIFTIGTFVIHGFNQIAEANRMKSEFISIVSHQLRSPLSIFKWTLNAMTREGVDAAALPGTITSNLMILGENTEKMIQLVNMLLEVSRIEARRMVFHIESLRLDLLTEEVVRSSQPYAEASRVTIHWTAAANLPPVRGDREKVKMVIQNLIDNAVRYSRKGGAVAVTIAGGGPRGVEWKIQDRGLGIPAADQRHIFEKFFRSRAAMEQHTVGSGLGLYIVRSFIQAFGGEIGFRSQEGEGSTFWFRLPVYQSA